MGTKFHGLMSLGLVGGAVVIAAVTAFAESLLLGVVYVAICAVAVVAVINSYCAKCPCKANCGHVIPGKLALMLTHRKPGPFTKGDLAIVGVGLVVLLGLPNVWLWGNTTLLVVFWALVIVGVAQIRSFVCRACGNNLCPLNKAYGASMGQQGR
jgi:hypothetical protein